MTKTLLKGVLFDFDGVLCSDYFYNTLGKTDPELYDDINTKIFREDKPLIRSWMRGRKTADDINRIVSKRLGKSYKFLKQALEISITKMRLNQQMLELVNNLKRKNVKVAILTDNMDVFTDILVPHNNLRQLFDEIFSSFEYRKLKADNDGEFIKEALDTLQINPKETAIVDDWDEIGRIFTNWGGHFFLYKNNFRDFRNWLTKGFQF